MPTRDWSAMPRPSRVVVDGNPTLAENPVATANASFGGYATKAAVETAFADETAVADADASVADAETVVADADALAEDADSSDNGSE